MKRLEKEVESTPNEKIDELLQPVYDILERLLNEHLLILKSEFRKNVTTDKYGKQVRSKWDIEIEYFRSNVVMPELESELDPQVLGEVIAELFLSLAHETQMELAKAHGSDTFEWYFEFFLENTIGDFVEEACAEESAEFEGQADFESPMDFEQYCCDLLIKAGWTANIVAGPGDQGVDIVAQADGVVAVFQCKLYSKPLGNTAVQEVYTGAAFYGAQVAGVITNTEYTHGARAAAEQAGVHLFHFSDLESFTPSDC